MSPYAPIIVALALAIAIPIIFLFLTTRLGPKNPNAAKMSTYETGIQAKRLARDRIPVKFYLVAMLFLLFDVEAVFLFPWAVSRRNLPVAADVGMAIFFGVLVLGLAYEWRKGAMEWD